MMDSGQCLLIYLEKIKGGRGSETREQRKIEILGCSNHNKSLKTEMYKKQTIFVYINYKYMAGLRSQKPEASTLIKMKTVKGHDDIKGHQQRL